MTDQETIRNFVLTELLFDDCRFTSVREPLTLEKDNQWIKQGYHGEMKYLEEHLKFKEKPSLLLNGVKSAIVVIKNYKNTGTKKLAQAFKIARYAVGRDYHTVIQEKLNLLIEYLKGQIPTISCYAAVDSRPIQEKTLALQSGIGFRGKNTLVIKPAMGSYFFIGVVLTTSDFLADAPLEWDCGNCRLCLDACPTQAFTEAYVLDARRCISYLTIEKKNILTEEEQRQLSGWLFGCDICQEVCPYNHEKVPLTDWKDFYPEEGVGFDLFSMIPSLKKIPRTSSLFRSRRQVMRNWKNLVNKDKIYDSQE